MANKLRLLAPLILTIATVGASSAPIFQFDEPSYMAGSFRGSGATWALVVSEGATEYNWVLDDDGRHVTHEYMETRVVSPAAFPGHRLAVPLATHEREPIPAEQPILIQGAMRSSAAFEASELSWDASYGRTTILSLAPNQCAHDALPSDLDLEDMLRPSSLLGCSADAQTVMVMQARPGGLLQVNLAGTSEMIEWRNLAADCAGCSGQPQRQPVAAAGAGASATATSIFYDQVVGLGPLNGTSLASIVILGGPILNTSGTGSAYFAGFDEIDCSDLCAENVGSGLTVEGIIGLDAMTPVDDGRLQAMWTGDAQAIRLGETNIAPSALSGWTVGATAGAIGLFAFWKFVLAPIVLRVAASQDPMENPRRKRIFTYVCGNPGATLREVVRQTETATGTVRHHISVLKRGNHIVEHRHGNTCRYFENHGKFDGNWSAEVLLRERNVRRIYEWVEANGPCIQKDLLEITGGKWGWGDTTTQYRLKKLVNARLLQVRLSGRCKVYEAVAPEAAHARRGPSVRNADKLLHPTG